MAVGRPQREDVLLGVRAARHMSYPHPAPQKQEAPNFLLSRRGQLCWSACSIQLSSPRYLIALVNQESGCRQREGVSPYCVSFA